MAKENTAVYIILGLLSHEDMSGYDIKKRVDATISRFWEIGYGQIYPTLARLEKEGLVTKMAGVEAKGPERNLYSITGTGREVLVEWLKLPEQKEYIKYEILLKLFFGSLVSIEDSTKRIGEFQRRHQENLKLQEAFKANLEAAMGHNKDHLFYYITVLFGERIYKAYLEWADEAVKLLEEAKAGELCDDGEGSSR